MTEIVTIGDATRIYALHDSAGHIRYVGKTIQPLRARLVAHKRAAANRPRLPVHWWTRKQLPNMPGIRWLETAGINWAARESWWIARFRAEGADLLNMTDGGEGLPGHKFSETHKQRIAAALRRGGSFACLRCGTWFWRKPREIRLGDNKFCCRACYIAWQRGNSKDGL